MADDRRQRHEHEAVGTVGDRNKSEVGRMVGEDEGYAGRAGAEARAEQDDSGD